MRRSLQHALAEIAERGQATSDIASAVTQLLAESLPRMGLVARDGSLNCWPVSGSMIGLED